MDLSIVIPVYNEAKSVAETIRDIKKAMEKAAFPWEIVIVDDGSDDGSREILKEIKEIRLISHKKNKGYGASLKTGIRAAKYSNICITDADGSYPVSMITELARYYEENGLDMVVGSRSGKNVSYSFIRKIPKYFIIKLANYISGSEIPDINSGMRIFDKEIALKFYNLYPNGFSFTITITMSMLCHGYDVEYYPIDYFRREGKSKIHPIKDTIRFFTLLSKIAVFFHPMKVFAPFALLLFFISVGFISRDIVFTKNLSDGSVLFPVLTVLVFFIGLTADMISKK